MSVVFTYEQRIDNNQSNSHNEIVIPKPPPPQIEAFIQDKQNNNVIATSHLKSPSVIINANKSKSESRRTSTGATALATTATITTTTTTATAAAAASSTITPPSSATATLKSDKFNGDSMNDELNHVLKLYREKRSNLDIHKTPEIFIQHTSPPFEVKQWLKAKGFSEYVVGKLGYLNGSDLFSLSRETLEEFCGIDEGRRLLSQITIQRNVSGYKTTRSSELLACLAKARKRIDEPSNHPDIE